jgi:hypothetical protein
MSIKYNKRPQNGPSVHKIYQHLPLQEPPKFTQIWIFGLKTNHLATLADTRPWPECYFFIVCHPGGRTNFLQSKQYSYEVDKYRILFFTGNGRHLLHRCTYSAILGFILWQKKNLGTRTSDLQRELCAVPRPRITARL